METLAGKVALVTGAGAGIGAATAKRLAAEGAEVGVVDIRGDAAEATTEAIEAAGGTALALRCDVADETEVNAMVADVVARFGRLDLAVNNAATATETNPVHLMPVAEFDRVIGVNLRGVFLCMRSEISAMLEVSGGSIVNLSSGMGIRAIPRMASYAASKHGVIGMTKVAALDYAKAGIRVNAVCPASVGTGMDPDILAMLNRVAPMGRLGHPDEIANLIAFLLSDNASYLTAGVYTADGGGTQVLGTAWASGAFGGDDDE